MTRSCKCPEQQNARRQRVSLGQPIGWNMSCLTECIKLIEILYVTLGDAGPKRLPASSVHG